MFSFKFAQKAAPAFDLSGAFLAMIDRTQATIQFTPQGEILDANENFQKALGYSRSELVGKHHSMLVQTAYAQSEAYKRFWSDLAAGKFFTDQFPRVAKDGSIVWIQATYAPCFDSQGKVVRVIKIATDITERQNGVEEISTGLRELSQGNLSHRVPHCLVPEVNVLADAYNQAVSQLSSVMSAVGDACQAVEHTAQDLTQGSAELSRRTEVQAATLEQTAAAIEELASSASAASQRARDAERSANQAMETARAGGTVAEDAVNAMSQIESSSSRVTQIITVIDDIAFQTNLLALNAGVEAARAGESGRGFAVVASEVRLLAVRSAEAASEIKTLIQDSSVYVKSGVGLVIKAGDELKKIISSVNAIHSHITEIANGAREQATTLSEINSGVAQLDSMTQQNAGMVDESAAAGQVLVGHARDLAQHVAGFQAAQPMARARSAPLRRAS